MREIIATGWGSEAWVKRITALIEDGGVNEVSLEERAQVFQDRVNSLAHTVKVDANKSFSFDIWWIGSSITSVHKDEDVINNMCSIEAALITDAWKDRQFRLSMRELEKLELTYFGKSCGWLSFWNKLRTRL